MKVAVTGGTGFVGGHCARALLAHGDEVVVIARRAPTVRNDARLSSASAAIDDEAALRQAFAGCDAVLHCAGINFERGVQTFARVHVKGTDTVVRAARGAGVSRLSLVSFLRARPACGSAYHESKWAAEEIVRNCGLEYTVLKPGVIYGRGDHMLDHLSRAFHTFPVFLLVGLSDRRQIRPVAVEDVARSLVATAHDHRLVGLTVPVLGPETLTLGAAVRRVAAVVGRSPWFVPAPLMVHRSLAWVFERVMTIPLLSRAQLRILAEGVTEPVLAPDCLPAGLEPATQFSEAAIRRGLPAPERFRAGDLRLCNRGR
jgi:uncharacterized protein YbjT (DUF2867 family)